jgi:hypothetical protein
MVYPRIENIDVMFCHGLVDALKCSPDRTIVVVDWDVAGLQPCQSQQTAPLLEHLQRIKRLTKIPVEFSRWSAPASTIKDLAFLLRFAPEKAGKFLIQAATAQTRSLTVVPAPRRAPTLPKNIDEYLAACLNRLPRGKRNQLRGALAESIRVERVEPASEAAARLEPAQRLQHDIAAQVAGLALLDVAEAVGERLLANEPGPGEPLPRSAASVTMAAERAVKLLQGLHQTQPTNLAAFRRGLR